MSIHQQLLLFQSLIVFRFILSLSTFFGQLTNETRAYADIQSMLYGGIASFFVLILQHIGRLHAVSESNLSTSHSSGCKLLQVSLCSRLNDGDHGTGYGRHRLPG